MAYVSQDKKKALAPAIKAVLNEYNMKGSISVGHHSSLVVTIKSGKIKFADDELGQVNEYWLDEHFSSNVAEFLKKLLAAMRGPDYFNHNDLQSDYFHCSHYTTINIGKWDKPYILTK